VSAELATDRRRVPRWALATAAIGLLVAAAVLAGPPAGDAPLDPTSVAPDGLRGVRDLLAEVGVESDVSLDPPVDTSTNVFVPLDLLDRTRREALLDWVEAGGTLVVADPGSPLHGLTATGRGLAGLRGRDRAGAGLRPRGVADVGEVLHAGWVGYEVPDGGTACFPLGEEGEAWLVVRPVGEGTIVALGSADPLTNAQLDRADNAVLAAALLGAAPGDRLVVVPGRRSGRGTRGSSTWWRPGSGAGSACCVLAVLLGLAWRGRRLGQPVAERLPPVVPAAELARSVAALLQRAGSRDGAARLLRERARRDVVAGLGRTRRRHPRTWSGSSSPAPVCRRPRPGPACCPRAGERTDERPSWPSPRGGAVRGAAVRGLPASRRRASPTGHRRRAPTDEPMCRQTDLPMARPVLLPTERTTRDPRHTRRSTPRRGGPRGPRPRPRRDREGRRRPGRGRHRADHRPARPWARPARGRAGGGQDAARHHARAQPRPAIHARAVHPGPDALRRHRARRSSTTTVRASGSGRGRCSPTSCSPTRSTAPRRGPRRRCSRRCRNARCPSRAPGARCPTPSWSWPPRTPSSTRAPTRSPRRSSTGSCSSSRCPTRTVSRSARSSTGTPKRPRWATPGARRSARSPARRARRGPGRGRRRPGRAAGARLPRRPRSCVPRRASGQPRGLTPRCHDAAARGPGVGVARRADVRHPRRGQGGGEADAAPPAAAAPRGRARRHHARRRARPPPDAVPVPR
jgi:hypothetical protein